MLYLNKYVLAKFRVLDIHELLTVGGILHMQVICMAEGLIDEQSYLRWLKLPSQSS